MTRTLAHATDRAVVEAARAHAGADRSWRLVDELPFETSRGYAASIGEDAGSACLAVKGAPEVLLARCTSIRKIRADRGGAQPGAPARASSDAAASSVMPMTPALRRAARALVQDLAADGLRVLAVAEAGPSGLPEPLSAGPGGHSAVRGNPGPRLPVTPCQRRATLGAGTVADLVDGLTLVGFLAIADTPRPSAAQAVQRLSRAGSESP